MLQSTICDWYPAHFCLSAVKQFYEMFVQKNELKEWVTVRRMAQGILHSMGAVMCTLHVLHFLYCSLPIVGNFHCLLRTSIAQGMSL